MEQEQFLTSSLFTFENMREGNYLYVDKTEFLWKLVRQPSSMFFFSRPRRFGKSLTLSTLKAIFQGKKVLFKGLYIANQPYDWKPYTIIHIDMGSISADTPEKLEYYLLNRILDIANDYHIEISSKYASLAFEELLKSLHDQNGKVVVLIDEYDKPILNNIENDNIAEFQKIMKGFYSVLKTCEPYERFVFITGVGKFLKVSIFSDLNNLVDISMSDDFATMCGYTEKELEDNFKTYIIDLASKHNIEYSNLLQKIKKWYDGYKFSEDCENVYNPVSFTKLIENKGKFKNYWFETGSPSILIKLFKKENFDIGQALNNTYREEIFTAFDPTEVSLIALMYQTGYLTIKDVKVLNERFRYSLGFPNFEVEESFYRYLLSNLNKNLKTDDSVLFNICDAINENNIDKMMSALNSFLSEIPYSIQIKNEKYYQSIFFSIFKLIGIEIKTEVQTSDGRIDALIENKNNIYIFEFKLDKSSDDALEQILKKEYYQPYLHSGKKIMLIGANFDSEKRKLSDWVKKDILA
jgi:hypothetical protein